MIPPRAPLYRPVMIMRWACLGLVLLAAAPARAQNADVVWAEAEAAFQAKDYRRSAQRFADAIKAGARDPRVFYGAACADARAGRIDQAFEHLDRAIDQGVQDDKQLARDTDLEALRADGRWKALLEKARSRRAQYDRQWNGPAFKTPFRPSLGEDEKIAGLSRLWSEAKINFANFDLVPQLDWDAAYLAALPRVRQAGSTLEYYRVLMELGAKLGDGHTNVYPPDQLATAIYSRPLVRTRLVEDKVLVIKVDDPALVRDGLVPGLEVVEIDGIAVRTYGERNVAPFQSASTKQDLATRTYDYSLLRGAVGTKVILTLRDAKGETFKRTIARVPFEESDKHAPAPPPFEVAMLPGDIAHVRLNGFDSSKTADLFEADFARLTAARALILDVRDNGGGSSQVGYRILATLTDKPFSTSRWRTRDYRPSYRAWGIGEMTMGDKDPAFQPNRSKVYKKPVVLLTSARTFSAAEDFAVAFDAMKRGPIVGEATGGSTGQPLSFDLPGGGAARVCTKRDTYPDGREFVGVGVQPQRIVHPTVADVRAGRDTVLEAALSSLQKEESVR
jgi:carboxyl-terminal processing protease